MNRKTAVVTMVLAMMVWAVSLSVYAAGPNFSPAIFADGMAYGTKGLGTLPAPNEHNVQSFDKLYVFTNGAAGQLPVAEAAPGNPLYNGGRWNAQEVTWNIAPLMVLTSESEILAFAASGDLTITSAGAYFECPLLPVK